MQLALQACVATPQLPSTLSCGTIQTTILTAFECSGDLIRFSVTSRLWSAIRNITLTLSQPASEDAIKFIRDRVAAIFSIPFFLLDAHPHQYRTSLAFDCVPCMDGDGRVLTLTEATPIHQNAVWKPHVEDAQMCLRWGPIQKQDTLSCTVIIDSLDDSSHLTAQALEKIWVLLLDGAPHTHILPDKPKNPQCDKCLTSFACYTRSNVCNCCGGPHQVRLHNTVRSGLTGSPRTALIPVVPQLQEGTLCLRPSGLQVGQASLRLGVVCSPRCCPSPIPASHSTNQTRRLP